MERYCEEEEINSIFKMMDLVWISHMVRLGQKEDKYIDVNELGWFAVYVLELEVEESQAMGLFREYEQSAVGYLDLTIIERSASGK